jgi:DNA-binding transcriptional MerR regulator
MDDGSTGVLAGHPEGGSVSSEHGVPATMSIGEVARRTGVTVPTLRAWEHRYELLCPVRTSGGHRRYNDEDVRRVLAVLDLAAEGWAVGAAARRVAAPGSGPAARPDVGQLRERLWSALDQALREMPEETDTTAPSGELPGAAQAEAPGVALGALGSSGSSVGAAVRQRRPTMAAAPAGPPDWDVLQATHEATRALLYITSVRDASDILVAVVQRLGGATLPARQADSSALPIDLSFGEGEPIVPVAEPLSMARLRLEQVLPGLVEDARRAVQLLRRTEDLDG